jgi:beta-carotene 3-hydroxylase
MIGIIITLATVAVMEGVTWCTHKFVMHGFLWYLHQDHHQKNPNYPLEKNDMFFIIFAIPSIACLYNGLYTEGLWFLFPIGLGIMIYGALYFLVHEVIIHKRLFQNLKISHPYFKGLQRAHKAHHKNIHKEESMCFGMLYVPSRYFKKEENGI